MTISEPTYEKLEFTKLQTRNYLINKIFVNKHGKSIPNSSCVIEVLEP